MKTPSTPRIAHVERLDGSVIITFDDGKCGLYSASLLHEIFSQAKDVTELELDDD